MQTLQVTTKNATQTILANAIARAQAQKPKVKKTNERGVYSVLSSNGTTWYEVRCNSQAKTATCTCKAVKPCLHLAATVNYHSFLVSLELAAQKAANEAAYQAKVAKAQSDLFG